MPRDDTVTLAPQTWTQLTANDVTAITFQVRNGPVYIVPTVGATPPTDISDGFVYETGEGEVAIALADLAPGIAATRVYAYGAIPFGAQVRVSHA